MHGGTSVLILRVFTVEAYDKHICTDLCSKNGVSGYPQLNLYRDGAFVDTFRKPRELELLVEYLHDHAEHTTKPLPTPPPPAITSAPKEEVVVTPPPPPANRVA